jgi:hypothetical protein
MLLRGLRFAHLQASKNSEGREHIGAVLKSYVLCFMQFSV